MIDGRRVVAILPARGGSKGIPRKNVRLLAGRPLITHVIAAAQGSSLIDQIVVTTDDSEIAVLSSRSGARVVRRPRRLAGDAVTIDPVIFHAVEALERTGKAIDIVVTLQPTSPLVRAETIDLMVRRLAQGDVDTILTVRRVAHLCWRRSPAGIALPVYPERKNRQQLDPLYFETGAVVATLRPFVTPTSRFGPRLDLHEVGAIEAIDIDDDGHWALAERAMSRRRVVFHVSAGLEIGTGHVHRALTLARRMTGHEILFVAHRGEALTRRLIEQGGFRLVPLDEHPRLTFVRTAPDIVINDVLDTGRDFIRFLRQEVGAFVVNFEDVGPGSREADLTFNAMYRSREAPHAFSGPHFESLREEFYGAPPRRVRRTVRTVLVTFGGTDPGDLTTRVLRALDGIHGDFGVTVVLGLGYRHERLLRGLIPSLRHRIRIKRNVRSMSELMVGADLMVTSYGRTLFEAAATGTPAIALAQNARELRHTFARVQNGVVALGLGKRCRSSRLRQVLRRVIEDEQERARLSSRLQAVGIGCGREIVVDLIFEQYRRSEDARSLSRGRQRR